MIRICFVTTISLTLKSFLLSTAEYLHNTGEFEISMISNPDTEFENNLPPYINFIPLRMKRGIGFDGPIVISQLKKIFKEYKFDIVQYSTPNASCYASIAAKKSNIKVRLYCQWGIAYVGFSGLKRYVFKMIEKHICKCSTWIEPDSISNLKFAHSEKLYTNCKSSVLWNGSACGINLKKFDFAKKSEYRELIRNKFSIPNDAFVFGYVGRITKDKGINELLQAFKLLNDNSYLLIVGPNDFDKTIDRNLLSQALSNQHIIFTGYTNEVEKYLAAMDCYVLPSYREGFGLSVIEAEAMGVPVIVTRIPGPIDAMIDGKTGFIVEKKDVESLLFALIKAKDKNKLAKMEVDCVNFARNNFDSSIFHRKIYEDRVKLLNM